MPGRIMAQMATAPEKNKNKGASPSHERWQTSQPPSQTSSHQEQRHPGWPHLTALNLSEHQRNTRCHQAEKESPEQDRVLQQEMVKQACKRCHRHQNTRAQSAEKTQIEGAPCGHPDPAETGT